MTERESERLPDNDSTRLRGNTVGDGAGRGECGENNSSKKPLRDSTRNDATLGEAVERKIFPKYGREV